MYFVDDETCYFPRPVFAELIAHASCGLIDFGILRWHRWLCLVKHQRLSHHSMFIFDVISMSFMNGVKIRDLDLAREADDADSSELDSVFVFVSVSALFLPGWIAEGSGSEGRAEENDPAVGEDCRERQYSTGVYRSRLDSSLLGGGLFIVKVFGCVTVVR